MSHLLLSHTTDPVHRTVLEAVVRYSDTQAGGEADSEDIRRNCDQAAYLPGDDQPVEDNVCEAGGGWHAA